MTVTIKKYLLVIAGTISLILGAIGIFIPILPTTPFLLLSSFCYIRSSKNLYDRLINHRIFGSYIYNYMKYRAVKKSVKIGGLILLWTTIGISFYLAKNLYVRILLFIVVIGVSIHLLTLKSLNK